MSSIFSKIVRGEIPSYKIAEDDHYLAFLDIFPLAVGHVLVIPRMKRILFLILMIKSIRVYGSLLKKQRKQ